MPNMDLHSEKEEGCEGITTFRIKYPNQASFLVQTPHHGQVYILLYLSCHHQTMQHDRKWEAVTNVTPSDHNHYLITSASHLYTHHTPFSLPSTHT
jgi:hypothetical protein